MSDQLHRPTVAGPEPVVEPELDPPTIAVDPVGGADPAAAQGPSEGASPFERVTEAIPALPIDPSERPEVLVGAAFAGGLAAALILKRLGR